jgi:hypothetical protein
MPSMRKCFEISTLKLSRPIAEAYHSAMEAYLLLKQHKSPVFPRNQQHPINRIRESAAVVHSKARKKLVLLVVA